MSDPSIEDQAADYSDEAAAPDYDPAYAPPVELDETDLALLMESLETFQSAIVVLERIFTGPIPGATLRQHAQWLVSLRESKRRLADTEQALADEVARLMGPEHMVLVDGVGAVTKHGHKSRTQWDKDGLRMSVADSRLVDTSTGEVVNESPLDKVLHVWNLGVPRLTALRERGLDPDEFCTVEHKPGFSIEITS